MADKPKGIGLLIGPIGKPKADEGADADESPAILAAKSLIKAIQGEDAEGVVEACKLLRDAETKEPEPDSDDASY